MPAVPRSVPGREPTDAHGALPITVETAVDPATARRFYQLYLETFGPLETRAVARQVLHEEEFLEEMGDARISKFVAWDQAGEAVAMSTLTAHLECIPWISPGYFGHHYPEHAARGAVYYLGFTLVHPAHRRSRLFSTMLRAVVDVLEAERAVCAYDICAYNDDVLRFGDNIETLLHRMTDVVVARIDTQAYYRAVFAGPPDRSGRSRDGGPR